MGKLVVASIKMIFRDRQALFWSLAFPVIFGLFDFTDTPDAEFTVVAEEPSPVSQALVEGLEGVDSFTVVESDDPVAARGALEDGETDVVLEVPSVDPSAPGGPGPRATVEVLYNEANADVNQVALGAVERIVNEVNLQLAGVTTPPISMDAQGVEGRSIDYYDYLLPGLVARAS